MNREELFQRIVLRGLSREEVEAYIRSSAAVEPARELLDRIYEETEGNPFFLSEVVALMTQEGTLGRGASGAFTVPEGVREALGRRLDRLSEECNELLTLAAVGGREFSHELLAATSGHGGEALLRLVEEALDGRVIEESTAPGEYRFTHALMQETLLGELSTARRVRIHAQIARALEELYGERADRHAAELAHHYVESALLNREHAAKAARFSETAARQAEEAAAWDEAIRHYESCLSFVTDTEYGLDGDEAALLVALGRCQQAAGDVPRAAATLHRAVELYRERGDGAGFASAVLELRARIVLRREVVLVEEALAALGDGDPHLQAHLLALGAATRGRDAEQLRARAAGLAEQHGFVDVSSELKWDAAFLAWEEMRLDEARSLIQEAPELTLSAGERGVDALVVAGMALAAAGRLDELQREVDGIIDTAREFRRSITEAQALSLRLLLAFHRCEWERVEQTIGEIPPAWWAAPAMRIALAEVRGFTDEAASLARAFADTAGPPSAVGLVARALLHAGDLKGARSAFEQWSERRDEVVAPPVRWASYAVVDDCLLAFADASLIRSAYEVLAPLSAMRLNGFSAWLGGGLDQLRGNLALRLDLVDEAEEWFHTGLEWAERERCPVEQGRNLQGLAEVAERRGEQQQSMEYLDRAGELFNRYGAKLYLDQVLARKQILKA